MRRGVSPPWAVEQAHDELRLLPVRTRRAYAAPLAYNISMKHMPMRKFAAIVRQTIEDLPDEFKPYLEHIVIDVEKEPSAEYLRQSGFTHEEIEAGETLYGQFIPFQHGGDEGDMFDIPNRILIFRNPLEIDFPDPNELRVEIRKTVLHEIAHHFGLTERDLDRFEENPDPLPE